MIAKLKTLKNSEGFIRYLKNTSWMIAEQSVRIIAGVFVGVWVARFLGPEKFGLLSYVVAFTAIFGGIAKLGLDGVLVRELVNDPEKYVTYLGTAFWLKVLGAFFVIGLIGIIVPFTSNNEQTNMFIFIIVAGLLFQSFEVIEFYFQSLVMAKIVSICKLTQLILSSVLKIYFVLKDADMIWFVLITVFDSVSLSISYFIAYKINKKSSFYKHFDLSIAKRLIQDTWPLIFSAIVVTVYMRIDQIMIKKMLGEYDVGIYSAAVKLSEVFYFIPVLISASLFPAILNAKKKNDEVYKKRLQWFYNSMAKMASAVILLMSFLSDWLILFLYGQEYQEAGQVLLIHIWAAMFVFLGVASSKWYLTENLQIFYFINTAIGAVINVVLNFKLIPLYGISGAAYATVISYAVSAYFTNFLWSKSRANFVMLSKSLLIYRSTK